MRDILESILAFNRNRTTGIALKYAAMAESPFRFLRGTCHLFYEDLSRNFQASDPTRSWICGDLHLENFGTYRGDNRLVYFDLNDFDEAVLAPVTWEMARMLTSIHLAIRTMKLPASEGDKLAARCLSQYTSVLASGKALVTEAGTARGLLKHFIMQVADRPQKSLLRSRTVPGSRPLKIHCTGTHAQQISPHQKKVLKTLIENWSQAQAAVGGPYEVIDSARRIAGTGSLGLERYVLVARLLGEKEKIRLLDLKEARQSSLLPWLKLPQPGWNNQAERVTTIQRRVQHVSPALLTPLSFEGKSFILRELQPIEDKMNLELCQGKLKKLEQIMGTMAEASASGQIRSGGQQGSSITDELKAFGRRPGWQKDLLLYAKAYCRQVTIDYSRYMQAYRKGLFKQKRQ